MRRALAWLLVVPLGLAGVGLLALLDLGNADERRATTPTAPAHPASDQQEPSSTSSTAVRSRAADTLATAKAADDPATLADVVEASEAAVRDREISEDELEQWATAQQIAYRTLARHPEWDAEVMRLVDPALHAVVEANVSANRELWSLTDPKPDLPDWRIVAPPPREELLAHYRAAGEEFGVPWQYLAAIHLVETRMGRIRGVSSAGAQGPMQFIPATWAAYGEGDVNDPADAIRAAARYLVDHGAPGDMDGALWAYNHSDHYVRAVSAHAKVMEADEAAYRGYYHWQVYYRLQSGDVLLPVGWTRADGHPEEG